jgi:hypothetical protein
MRIVRNLQKPTSRDDVIAALKSERTYQVRRWGFRQEDGSMVEASHDVFEWVVYIQDYLNEGLHSLSREPDELAYKMALDSLRKCATMAIAYFEYKETDPYKQVYTTYVRPPESAGVEWYYLRVQRALNAYIDEIGDSRDTILAQDAVMQFVIDISIVCFEKFGIQPRDLSQIIINGRDKQIA